MKQIFSETRKKYVNESVTALGYVYNYTQYLVHKVDNIALLFIKYKIFDEPN